MADKVRHPEAGRELGSTEFHSLDFLACDAHREARIEALFGPEVLSVLRADRARMIREIFGTEPLDQLPQSKRSLNFFALYRQRLSGGRVLFLPLFFVLWVFSGAWFVVGRIAAIVKEILEPEGLAHARQSGRAPFHVAQRKIVRMKGPGLLEAMRTRVLYDPGYSGAPSRFAEPFAPLEQSELERDLDFLGLRMRDRAQLRARGCAGARAGSRRARDRARAATGCLRRQRSAGSPRRIGARDRNDDRPRAGADALVCGSMAGARQPAPAQ